MHFFSVVLVCMGFVASGNFQKMLEHGMTCDEKRVALDQHNEYRMMIANGSVKGQPKASNMQKLIWDDGLEAIAQKWADNMKWQHNPDRKDDRWPWVGENMFTVYGNGAGNDRRWKDAVKAWWDEINIYTYGPIETHEGPTTLHYTQLVWADTIRVGCGYVYFVDKETYHKIYICDYAPGGNYIGQYPYKTGKGCEKLCCTGDQCNHPYGNKC